MGNQQVETVTCDDYFSHVDFQGYGTVNGTGCSITGKFDTHNGDVGNTDISFSMSDGTSLVLHNCEAASAVSMPGYHTVALNCTYRP